MTNIKLPVPASITDGYTQEQLEQYATDRVNEVVELIAARFLISNTPGIDLIGKGILEEFKIQTNQKVHQMEHEEQKLIMTTNKTIHDLEIKEIIIDTENGFFTVVFKDDESLKSLQCCLENDGSIEENGRIVVRYKKEINEPDSGYDWGISKEVNEWAVEQGLAAWSDINTFLCDQAQTAGVTITQNRE